MFWFLVWFGFGINGSFIQKNILYKAFKSYLKKVDVSALITITYINNIYDIYIRQSITI